MSWGACGRWVGGERFPVAPMGSRLEVVREAWRHGGCYTMALPRDMLYEILLRLLRQLDGWRSSPSANCHPHAVTTALRTVAVSHLWRSVMTDQLLWYVLYKHFWGAEEMPPTSDVKRLLLKRAGWWPSGAGAWKRDFYLLLRLQDASSDRSSSHCLRLSDANTFQEWAEGEELMQWQLPDAPADVNLADLRRQNIRADLWRAQDDAIFRVSNLHYHRTQHKDYGSGQVALSSSGQHCRPRAMVGSSTWLLAEREAGQVGQVSLGTKVMHRVRDDRSQRVYLGIQYKSAVDPEIYDVPIAAWPQALPYFFGTTFMDGDMVESDGYDSESDVDEVESEDDSGDNSDGGEEEEASDALP